MNWLKIILGLVSLVRQVTTYLHDKKMMDAGAALQVSRALVEANKAIDQALAAAREAEERHKKTPTDDAFDRRFERKDE